MVELSHCAGMARRDDRDRFLCALFAPAEEREALFALLAFNAEIARLPEMVSEPLLGHIRLQWWREALDGVFAGLPENHPVLVPLALAHRRFGLERAVFEALLRGRERDFDGGPPETLEALEAYAADTVASLSLLMLDVLKVRSAAVREAAHHVAIAWGLSGLLRAVPFHAAQERLYLPADALRRCAVAPEAALSGNVPSGLADVVAGVAERAWTHLDAARGLAGAVPRSALPVFLPAVLARCDLRTLEKTGFDPAAPRVQRRGMGRLMSLVMRGVSGRIWGG